ncbi:MAG: hypothetical protein BWY95_02696 [Bacteroidetes bacterium ADurb.BinA104]|nr:MAG: hypothetical protein BWY95_02696 [Bacteroidetes bacterium ADurb.BinA104]
MQGCRTVIKHIQVRFHPVKQPVEIPGAHIPFGGINHLSESAMGKHILSHRQLRAKVNIRICPPEILQPDNQLFVEIEYQVRAVHLHRAHEITGVVLQYLLSGVTEESQAGILTDILCEFQQHILVLILVENIPVIGTAEAHSAYHLKHHRGACFKTLVEKYPLVILQVNRRLTRRCGIDTIVFNSVPHLALEHRV